MTRLILSNRFPAKEMIPGITANQTIKPCAEEKLVIIQQRAVKLSLREIERRGKLKIKQPKTKNKLIKKIGS